MERPSWATRVLRALVSHVHILKWLPHYKREHLRGDIFSGLTVGIMLIPQGLAYAILAGMPPVYGLYCGFLPALIYAIFGTCPQLSVGPVAVVSLLLNSALDEDDLSGDEAVQTALGYSLMVGVSAMTIGLLRLGFIENLLSHPILSGYISAVGIIVATNQMDSLTGIGNLPRSSNILVLWWYLLSHVPKFGLYASLMGFSSIALLVAFQMAKNSTMGKKSRYIKLFPATLFVVVVGTLVCWAFRLDEHGLSVLGDVPQGLPSLSFPSKFFTNFTELFPLSLSMTLLAYLEGIAMAKKMGMHHKYHVSSDHELVALGCANIVGSFFYCFPVAGSLSRTAVNDLSGAVTGLSSVICSLVIMCTLLLLTPLFYYLPHPIMAAIIIVAVSSLVDVDEVRYLWRTRKLTDLTLLISIFIITIATGPELGIFAGVTVSTILIYNSNGGGMNITTTIPEGFSKRVVVLQVSAALHYVNISALENELNKWKTYFHNSSATPTSSSQSSVPLITAPEVEADRYCIIIDGKNISWMDSTALHFMMEFVESTVLPGKCRITVCFLHIEGVIKEKLTKCGLLSKSDTAVFESSEDMMKFLVDNNFGDDETTTNFTAPDAQNGANDDGAVVLSNAD